MGDDQTTQTGNGRDVLIDLTDRRGYGDIVAGLSLIRTLLEDGVQPYVGYSGGRAAGKFSDVVDPKTRKAVREWSMEDDGDFISITPVSDSRDELKEAATDAHIDIREYDQSRYGTVSTYQEDDYMILVRPGLGFKPSIGDIQPGIYHDTDIEDMVEHIGQEDDPARSIEEMRSETLQELLETSRGDGAELLDGRVDEVIESDWSFAYKSEIDSLRTFFDTIQAAEDELERPLYIFTVGGGSGSLVAERRGWSMYNMVDSRMMMDSEENESPVSVVNIDTIPNRLFKRLNALSDTLSLVTGDHSLSQALQVAGSDLSSPFLYQCATWKMPLAQNMAEMMAETSEDAAALFNGYIQQENDKYYSGTVDADIERLAQLVYDEQARDEYIKAAAGAEQYFTGQRREAGIDEAELLWSVNDTIGRIVDGLQEGRDVKEIVDSFLPDAYREETASGETYEPATGTGESYSGRYLEDTGGKI